MKKSTINYPYSITTTDTDISYLYNAQDLRIFKHVETPSNTIAEYYLRNSSGQELGIFTATANNDTSWTWYVQGAERIAKIIPQANQQPNAIATSYNNNQTFYVRDNDTLYHTEYYFTDHLGNTRMVYKGASDSNAVTKEIHYMADYYPFGKVLRQYAASEEERYQFNGKEKDQVTKYFDFGARLYDGDIGKFMSVDPMAYQFPNQSPFMSMDGNPILMIDPTGMSATKYEDELGNKLADSDDGNDATVTIFDENKESFLNEFNEKREADTQNGMMYNESWIRRFGMGLSVQPGENVASWALNAINPGSSSILSQSKNVEKSDNGFSIDPIGPTLIVLGSRLYPKRGGKGGGNSRKWTSVASKSLRWIDRAVQSRLGTTVKGSVTKVGEEYWIK